jgi:type II secretion system protein I
MIRRSGFTLLEVMVALAIFVAAFAALSQLYSLGTRAAVDAALQTQAAVRAEAKMAEVLAGVESLEAASEMPFEDDANWSWGLEVNEGPHADVYEIVVTVVFQNGSGPPAMTYSLVRFRRDPQLILDEAAAAAEEDES